ncbi:MAG: GAF domain-containing protein [Burkholderiaceae bacterium]
MPESTMALSAALSGIPELARACADRDPQALFSAVDEYARLLLRQTLCTVNRYEPEGERLIRLYSSNPSSYPVGGSKDKSGSAWGRQVLHERRLFIGEGEEAIRQSFDDHTVIHKLGLRSVINVPIVAQDTCLGTLNFLMRTAVVDASMIQWAQLAGLLATPGFLTLYCGRLPSGQ